AVLALGAATPLFSLYVKLPPGGATLRYPHRLFWITGFCLAMFSAFAVERVSHGEPHSPSRSLPALVALGGSTALYLLTPGGLRRQELVVLAVVVGALCAAGVRPAASRTAAWVVAGAVVANLLAEPVRFPGRL